MRASTTGLCWASRCPPDAMLFALRSCARLESLVVAFEVGDLRFGGLGVADDNVCKSQKLNYCLRQR
jgi:hypothetical protein